MALRSRLNKSREKRNERELSEGEGGRRDRNRDRDRDEEEGGIEIQEQDNSRSKARAGDNNLDDEPDESVDHSTGKDRSVDRSKGKEKEKDKDNKSETTGRSIASRFRRNKKPEDKPIDEEQEPLNSRFGDRNGDSKNKDSASHGERGSKASGDGHGESDDLGRDLESGQKDGLNELEKDLEVGPLRVLQPIRTDPVMMLKTRKKKLERLTADFVPEIHIIGNILSGSGIVQEVSEGASCRWKVDGGSGWEHLGGELFGQTQVAYPAFNLQDAVPFNHPIDLHFAEPGIQTWGSPRLMLQCYRLDIHGRRILAGYGFVHLPTTKGLHKLEVNLWRPTGTSSEEMDSTYLGRVPALLTHEPIYDSAWDERCRLVTVPAGSVFLELFVMTRFMSKHNADLK